MEVHDVKTPVKEAFDGLCQRSGFIFGGYCVAPGENVPSLGVVLGGHFVLLEGEMRKFETLVKEARHLSDEELLAWFDGLTPEERALFLDRIVSLLDEIRQLWEEDVLPVLTMLWEDLSARIEAVWEIVGENSG